MSLRTFNIVLLAVLLAGCALLWSRELRLRDDFAAETKRQAALHVALTDEKSRTAGLREDLAELRGQLEKTRAQRAEAQELALRQAADFKSRTVEWQASLRRWELAVGERDTRLKQMTERENVLTQRLNEAVQRLQAAANQLREMEKRRQGQGAPPSGS